MRIFIATIFVFLGVSAQAGFPCPSDSCNPYNGCTEGCQLVYSSGSASCNGQSYETALQQAQQAASYSACGGQAFLKTAWNIVPSGSANQCVVTAQAGFWCLQ